MLDRFKHLQLFYSKRNLAKKLLNEEIDETIKS